MRMYFPFRVQPSVLAVIQYASFEGMAFIFILCQRLILDGVISSWDYRVAFQRMIQGLVAWFCGS